MGGGEGGGKEKNSNLKIFSSETRESALLFAVHGPIDN